jgi:hypothetical protein
MSEISALMEMSMANIARGLAGENIAAIGAQQVRDCLGDFCREIDVVASAIIRPDEATEIQELGGCISSMQSIAPYSPEITQVNHLTSTVERLQKIAGPLRTTLDRTYEELERQKCEKQRLESSLTSLRATLAHGKGLCYPGQAALVQIGTKVCSYLGGTE